MSIRVPRKILKEDSDYPITVEIYNGYYSTYWGVRFPISVFLGKIKEVEVHPESEVIIQKNDNGEEVLESVSTFHDYNPENLDTEADLVLFRLHTPDVNVVLEEVEEGYRVGLIASEPKIKWVQTLYSMTTGGTFKQPETTGFTSFVDNVGDEETT